MTETLARFEELKTVRVLVRRFGVRGADVDDVAQEVAKALHAKALSDRGTTLIDRRALVWGVARRAALYHRRRNAKRWRAMAEAELLMIAPAEPTPEEQAISREDLARAARALAVLRSAQPALYEVLSRQITGEAVTAIAEASGVPQGTAHTRLRRARKAFEAMVRRQAAEQTSRVQRARFKTGV